MNGAHDGGGAFQSTFALISTSINVSFCVCFVGPSATVKPRGHEEYLNLKDKKQAKRN